MTRIIQRHPILAARSLPRLVLAALAALLLAASVTDAALTTGTCLAQKRVAWATLRKCQGTEEAKQLKGKPADLAQCLTKLQTALTKITAKATKAEIPCRYWDNGDGTVTDYDTGLQWEKKDGADGVPALGNPHDVDNTYAWSTGSQAADGPAFGDFLDKLNRCTSTDAQILGGGFAGYCDWRLPTVVELQAILKDRFPCGTSPCIDPVFGPTVFDYWSATTDPRGNAGLPAWFVGFDDGEVGFAAKGNAGHVRAVRADL